MKKIEKGSAKISSTFKVQPFLRIKTNSIFATFQRNFYDGLLNF